MEPVSLGFKTEEQKPIFTLAGEQNTATTDSYVFADTRGSRQETVMSPMTPATPSLGGTDLLNLLAQQEPRVADTAPSVAEMEELLTHMRLNASDQFSDEGNLNNYYAGYNRPESASTSTWSDNTWNSRNNEMIDTFDFLVKSVSSANNYVSMLTREQLSVLRCIRPSLLYDILQGVAKARGNRRMRRALPNECAFCKNNGENEEWYGSHALKDARGRVLCPVLRAFRCPRCGATGDDAHTIKYCHDNNDGSSGLSSRRQMPSASLLLNSAGRAQNPAAPSPASPPAASLPHSALWSNFNLN